MPAPLYGLVLAGGRSSRMGADKATLIYHGRPQAEHALDLLKEACIRVFLSCRADQAALPGYAGHPQVHDHEAYAGFGPLGGILSALAAHPDAAFLVAACDLPFLDNAAVAALAAGRDPESLATAFEGPLPAGTRKGAHDPARFRQGAQGAQGPALPDLSLGPSGRLPEPLFAIYEPAMRARMLELLSLGIDCPRKAIVKSPCRILPAPDPAFLANVNDREDLRKARESLPPGPDFPLPRGL